MADSVPNPGAPLEVPIFAVVREGSALRPSVRFVGRVGGAPINVPTSDRAKALLAFERLVDQMLTGPKLRAVEDEETPAPSPGLPEIWASIQVMIEGLEHVRQEIVLVQESLAGAKPVTPEPPAPPLPKDIWADAFALAEEPAGLDKPLEAFDALKFAEYCVFARSPINRTKLYPDQRRVLLAQALATGGILDKPGEVYANLVAKWGVDRDVAIAALLTGLVDPYDTSFDARLERDVAHLAGTVHPETVNGEAIPRFVRLDLEGVYRKLMPSGSGGQAGQGGAS